jgi:hypothetical protein
LSTRNWRIVTGETEMFTVAMLLSTVPSLALNVKLSEPLKFAFGV